MLGWVLLGLLVLFLAWAWWKTRKRSTGVGAHEGRAEMLRYFNDSNRTASQRDPRRD